MKQPFSKLDPLDLILHVGLMKTGTTTIQNKVLAGSAGYLGNVPSMSGGVKRLLSELRDLACFHQFFDPREIRSRTCEWVERVRKYENRGHLCISVEELTTWPNRNDARFKLPIGFESPSAGDRREPPPPLASFLRDHLVPQWSSLGRVEVVLTIRNQSDWLASLYAQRAHARRNASQEDFERQVEELCDMHDPSIDWDLLVQELESAVGKDALMVLVFEEMGADRFTRDLSKAFRLARHDAGALMAPEAPRDNVRNIANAKWRIRPYAVDFSVRAVNKLPRRFYGREILAGTARRFFDPVFNPLARMIIDNTLERSRGDILVLTDATRRLIRNHCENSNRRLSTRLGRDLNSLGY